MSKFPKPNSKVDVARMKGIVAALPPTPKAWVIERNVIVSRPKEEKFGPRRFEIQRIVVLANSVDDAKDAANLAKMEREERIGHQFSGAGAMR